MNDQTIYSHHIFLCPFRIESDFCYDEIGSKNHGQWEKFLFKINSGTDFSERVYFFDFVYKAIFNDDLNNTSKYPLKQYYYKPVDIKENIDSPYYFTINRSCTDNKSGKKIDDFFSLQIDNITMNIYESGIGVIAYHLNNCSYADIESIKKINDIGRRVFPQFMNGSGDSISFDRSKFIPTKIIISKTKIDKENDIPSNLSFPSISYDFGKIEKEISVGKGFAESFDESKLLPCYITSLISKFSEEMKVSPLIDDRMFVISWIGNRTVIDKVYTSIYKNEAGELDTLTADWKNSEDWHNLLFCDFEKNSNHSSFDTRKELNQLHTYSRWENWQTLFGVTKYSFIAVTNGAQEIDFIRQHTMTIYFQMVQLCLVQRASILKFSKDAADLAGNIKLTSNTEALNTKALNRLQINYVRFINRLYFREVTAQEQGIDLYNMLQEHMGIPDQLKELDAEINEMAQLQGMLNNEEDNKNQKIQNQNIEDLTKVATLFLIPTLITGLLGVNIVDLGQKEASDWNILGWICFILLSLICLVIIKYGLDKLTFKWINNKRENNVFLLITAMTIFVLGLLTMYIITKFN